MTLPILTIFWVVFGFIFTPPSSPVLLITPPPTFLPRVELIKIIIIKFMRGENCQIRNIVGWNTVRNEVSKLLESQGRFSSSSLHKPRFFLHLWLVFWVSTWRIRFRWALSGLKNTESGQFHSIWQLGSLKWVLGANTVRIRAKLLWKDIWSICWLRKDWLWLISSLRSIWMPLGPQYALETLVFTK